MNLILLGKIVWLVSMIMQGVIRHPYRKNNPKPAASREEVILLTLIGIGAGVLPLIYFFADWLSFADYPAMLPVVLFGMVIMASGLWLFWRSHTDLGSNWSSTLEIYDEHKLVTKGVYQYIRHPMYAANWLMMLGQALLLSNWLVGFAGLATFAALYFVRVPKEEAMMLQEFGEQYQTYMATTGRIIPKRAQPS